MSSHTRLVATLMFGAMVSAEAWACFIDPRLHPIAPASQSIDCPSGFVIVEKAARGVRVSCAVGVNDATVALHDPHHEIQVLRMETTP